MNFENMELDLLKTDYKSEKMTAQVDRVIFIKTGLVLICKRTHIKEGLEELSILKKLNQSNYNCFPKLIDFKMTKQTFQIYTSYIEGITFAQLFKDKMRREDALQNLSLIVQNAIKAVVAIHNEGILHLDLKPENMLIDKHNNVFILDFSTSIFTNNKAQLNEFVGSWGYIAPEIMLASSKVDESSDYYSLGKVLIELIGKQHHVASMALYEKLLLLTSIQQGKRKEIMKDLIKTLA